MTTNEARPLSLHRPQRATESFAAFSQEERERRLNSGDEFDQALFDEAVGLVIRKLEKLQEEGLA